MKRHTATFPSLVLGTALAVAMLDACGGRTLSGINGDAGPMGDGTVTHKDGTPNSDGTLPDHFVPPPDSGPGCIAPGDAWKPVDVALDSIEVLTSEAYPDRIPEGVAIRIRARFSVGGCDQAGPISWQVDPQDHVITLFAKVWQYLGERPCPQTETQVARYAVLTAYQLSRGPWTVMDGMPNIADPVSASFRIGRCPFGDDCQCDQGGGGMGQPGDFCMYDCECAHPAVCVHDGFQMPGDTYGECRMICNSDGDCPDTDHCELNAEDMPEGVCIDGRRPCNSDGDCRAGYACLPGQMGISLCQPTMDPSDAHSQCNDDCDCPLGYRCTDMGARSKQCEIACLAQADCPGLLCCGMWMDPNLYTGPTCTECMDATAPAPID